MSHKVCNKCQLEKPFEDFHKHRFCKGGYNTVCKNCRKPLSRIQYEKQTTEYKIWYRSKFRAKKRNIDFNIEIEDINVPEYCPILKLKIEEGSVNSFNSPSIDRIDPLKGYIKGNIRIISNRANMLKNNATVEEIECILQDLKRR